MTLTDIELDEMLRKYLEERNFQNKFYSNTDVTDENFALDFSLKPTLLEEIPSDIRRWLNNLVYLEMQNRC